MSVSREYLARCSAATGYDASSLEKVIRLGELAGDITKHGLLGESLALKGGTALQLCFGPPSRLSVDLDFNYIGGASREKMLADRPAIEEALLGLGDTYFLRGNLKQAGNIYRKIISDYPKSELKG